MVVHVGIDLLHPKAVLYDSRKNAVEFDIRKLDRNHNPEKLLRAIFTTFLSKIDEEIGFCCISMGKCNDRERRKNLVQILLEFGCQNVEIISYNVALYLNVISKTNYSPKNNDIIWMLKNEYERLIWKIIDMKAILMEHMKDYKKSYYFTQDLEALKTVAESKNLAPSVILYSNKEPPSHKLPSKGAKSGEWMLFYNRHLKEIFPNCLTFEYDSDSEYDCHRGALIKARIMAGDSEVLKFDAENILHVNLHIKLNEKEVFFIPKGQFLPFEKEIKLDRSDSKKFLTINQDPADSNLEKPLILPVIKSRDIAKAFIVISTKKSSSLDVNVISFKECFWAECASYNKLSSNFDKRCNGKSKVYHIPPRIKNNDENIMAVGIDLGTSRCCVAVNRRNGIETVALDNDGSRLLPSYVSYDEKNEKCGQIVIQRLPFYAKYTAFDVKRIIGQSHRKINIDSSWPFKLVKTGLDSISISLTTNEGQIEEKKPEEISAVLLKHMKKKAEEFQGKKLSSAVITYPAEFSEGQICATREAAKLAGWKTIHLLPEPIAAAFAYFIERPLMIKEHPLLLDLGDGYIGRPLQIKETLLLLDLGGGTLDVCILEIQNDEIQIMSRNGDLNLGGRDFDNCLIQHFWKKLVEDYMLVESKINRHKLMKRCQEIKENLSVNFTDFLDVENFDISKDGSISISRSEFEDLSKWLLIKINFVIETAFTNIGYKYEKIERVLHVGGGSRMPMIKKLLEKKFPEAEHCCLQQPDEAVAIGAAYHAYSIFSE